MTNADGNVNRATISIVVAKCTGSEGFVGVFSFWKIQKKYAIIAVVTITCYRHRKL